MSRAEPNISETQIAICAPASLLMLPWTSAPRTLDAPGSSRGVCCWVVLGDLLPQCPLTFFLSGEEEVGAECIPSQDATPENYSLDASLIRCGLLTAWPGRLGLVSFTGFSPPGQFLGRARGQGARAGLTPRLRASVAPVSGLLLVFTGFCSWGEGVGGLRAGTAEWSVPLHRLPAHSPAEWVGVG